MIKSIEEKQVTGIEIDLTGPQGNAFFLLGTAQSLAKQLGYSSEAKEEMLKEMQSSDYEHLLSVMEKHFGEYLTMYR